MRLRLIAVTKEELQVGKSYVHSDPKAGDGMAGAILTITKLYGGSDAGLNVAYDFKRRDGITGSGTMSGTRAIKFLKPLE